MNTNNPAAGGYPAEAFQRIAALERGNYWFESRNRLIVWAMRRFFPDARTFLDVGCGTGYVLQALHQALPHLALTGTDFLEEGLSIARTRVPGATFTRMNAQQLVVDGRMDVAGSFDVLEHIHEDGEVLRRISGVLKPGGGLLVAVPQHQWLWSSADEQAQHVRRYSREEMTGRIREAGFEVLFVTSFVSLLLPLMAVSRWRDARKTKGPSASELQLPAPLNATLRAVLTVERAFIRAGLSFPAGGTLFVVARKPTAGA